VISIFLDQFLKREGFINIEKIKFSLVTSIGVRNGQLSDRGHLINKSSKVEYLKRYLIAEETNNLIGF
jgi:hypothetical protein